MYQYVSHIDSNPDSSGPNSYVRTSDLSQKLKKLTTNGRFTKRGTAPTSNIRSGAIFKPAKKPRLNWERGSNGVPVPKPTENPPRPSPQRTPCTQGCLRAGHWLRRQCFG